MITSYRITDRQVRAEGIARSVGALPPVKRANNWIETETQGQSFSWLRILFYLMGLLVFAALLACVAWFVGLS